MNKLKPKVAIVGTGNVGSTFAFALMVSGLAREIVLVDRNEKRALGEAMDLNHGLSFAHPSKIHAGGYEACGDADVVVITAGARQKAGQARLDLVQENTEIFKDMIPRITKEARDAILLVVTNPVDILTYAALKISGFPSNRVIGSGTVLDSSRFRYSISEHCDVDPRNVHAYIIGEHGDTELPVWSHANIGGMILANYCSICGKGCEFRDELGKIFEEVKSAAYKIIESKGATYYGIAQALVKIAGAILRDENSVLPVSSLINGYYGVKNTCLSLPSIVNKQGIVKVLALELSKEEEEQFRHSARTLRAIIDELKI
jgi:L-lactate dehydrogenase